MFHMRGPFLTVILFFSFSLQNSMNLPPDKARLLRQYDNEKKWELICDQVGPVSPNTTKQTSPSLSGIHCFLWAIITLSPQSIRIWKTYIINRFISIYHPINSLTKASKLYLDGFYLPNNTSTELLHRCRI